MLKQQRSVVIPQNQSNQQNGLPSRKMAFGNPQGSSCAHQRSTPGRAFCAGADLKEWAESNKQARYRGLPPSGFGGLSRREGKKPVVIAVNGLAYGGGCEMVINGDLVVASETATFALPEGRRGVLAAGGSLSRLVLTVGRQRAMDMALTGRPVSAQEAHTWGFVNIVVPKEADSLQEAIRLAVTISESSPDSIIVTRKGVNLGWEGEGADKATEVLLRDWYPLMNKGPNMIEGVKAFSEKRSPEWVPSKI
jgi:enoyl-CoA hydratase/carnithine racemase